MKYTNGAIKSERDLISRIQTIENGSFVNKLIAYGKVLMIIAVGLTALYYTHKCGLLKSASCNPNRKEEEDNQDRYNDTANKEETDERRRREDNNTYNNNAYLSELIYEEARERRMEEGEGENIYI